MSLISWFAKPSRPQHSGEALAFVRSFIREVELPAAILSVQGRGGSETVAFRPGDPALAPFLLKHAARRVHILTSPMAQLSATRIVSVIGVPADVMAFDPRPAIAVETPKGIAAAWRLVNPASAMKAHDLAAKIAERIGGAAGGQFFPVPGCGRLSLLQHLKGPKACTLVTSFDRALGIGQRQETAAGGPLFVSATDIKAEPIDWLWGGIIPCRALTLVAGKAGMGKSQFALMTGATVSCGGTWPDGSRAEAGTAVIAETEDDWARVTMPRLMAAGANMERIKSAPLMDLSKDIASLRQHAGAIPDLRLLVLSPVLTFFGSGALDEVTMRAKLKPLLDWAAERRIAVLGITHPPKGAKSEDAFAGSEVFLRAARAAWSAVVDPADDEPIIKRKRRLLVCAKNNLGDDTLRMPYRIVGVTLPMGIETSRVEFLPNGQDGGTPRRWTIDEAEEHLRQKFAAGPVNSSDLAVIPNGTRDRALKRIGAVKEQIPGERGFLWRMQED